MAEGAKDFGKKGEDEAARHLAGLGYEILERNYRTPAGELDIIARDGHTLVFVEVKSGRGGEFGPPELRVHPAKQKIMARAAAFYLSDKGLNVQCRFDVVAVTKKRGAGVVVKVLKDAFETAGGY